MSTLVPKFTPTVTTEPNDFVSQYMRYLKSLVGERAIDATFKLERYRADCFAMALDKLNKSAGRF